MYLRICMPMVPDCFQLWSILLLERLHNQGQNLHLKRPLKTVPKTHIQQNGFNLIQDIPCLIIWGQKDNLIPIDYANEFKKVFKNTDNFIQIDDAGHAPFVEKTALVYESMRTFLTKHS